MVADYGRLLRLAGYDRWLPRESELLLKLNLSWTKYFPACSTQPWQLEGVVQTLLADGYRRERLHPVENKTVVTNPRMGARDNKWMPILERAGLPFIPLPEVEWITYPFRSPLLKLNDIFPEGIEIPKMFVGASVLHLPAETFVEYQLYARSLSGDVPLAVAAYGDGGPWYIPLERSYAEGGYEPSVSWVSTMTEPMYRSKIEELIRRA